MRGNPESAIAIFPLENVVLLPRIQVPLRIFEPRYRQLTADALSRDRRIGMVVVRPEAQVDMRGEPAVFAVGCEGVITTCKQLPDGRYTLTLQGRQRFRIRSELPPHTDRPYRMAEVEALREIHPESDREHVRGQRRELMSLVATLLARLDPGWTQGFDTAGFEQADDVSLVNALIQSLDFDATDKQSLVEVDRIRERYEMLAGLIRFRLSELANGTGPNTSGPRNPRIMH